MNQLLFCVTQQHDYGLLAIAALLCLLSSFLTVMMLTRGRATSGSARMLWLAMAGACGGFGIWSTHFIAMVAYDPGVAAAYELKMTLLSLLVAVCATGAAVTAAVCLKGWESSALAGLLFGLGVGLMHFMGMSAMQVPGAVGWARDTVVVSLLLGTMFSIAAFRAASQGARVALPTVLTVLAVLSLHFTAMSGVSIQPGPGIANGGSLLSPGVLVLLVAAVSLSLLVTGLAASFFALKSERSAARSDLNFRMLVEGVQDYAIYMLDTEGHVTSWNSGAERAKGYTAAEIIGRHFGIFYPEAERARDVPALALRTAREQGKFEAEGIRLRKDGSSFWAHVVIDPIYASGGKLAGYAKITRDITARRANQERLAAVTRNLDLALENLTHGLCMFDKDERLIVVNCRYSRMFNFPEGFIKPGLSYREIVEAGYRANIAGDRDYLQIAKDHYERHMKVIRSGGGSLVQHLSSGSSIQFVYNPLREGGWVATFEDVTERLRSQEQISFMAKHDVLTGLPNRAAFNAAFEQEIQLAARTSDQLAVVNIDLDKFKEINDQHGHSAGDEVLSRLSQRLKALTQPGEMLARFGGDEFAAFKRFREVAELEDFIHRLERALTQPIDLAGFEIKPGASIGVALCPSDGQNAELLLANADLAMYRAKSALTQKVCFYEVEMDEAARKRRNLVADLWKAIERDEFHLNYQVQQSVSNRKITGYEVLLRWRHPERGNVPPMDFITLAEECGAILPIGEWVLREACREAASWSEPHKIAVNLSPVQLCNTDMAATVLQILVATGLSPARLEIEITESSIITDKERALNTLRQLKSLGVSIAIDDFGTGYSSLETLRAFPFDKIKLDKSFMREVESSLQSTAIIRAILALGRSLDVPVLAEGVETQAQLDILREEGCDEAQGYLLGRPADREVFRPLRNVA